MFFNTQYARSFPVLLDKGLSLRIYLYRTKVYCIESFMLDFLSLQKGLQNKQDCGIPECSGNGAQSTCVHVHCCLLLQE